MPAVPASLPSMYLPGWTAQEVPTNRGHAGLAQRHLGVVPRQLPMPTRSPWPSYSPRPQQHPPEPSSTVYTPAEEVNTKVPVPSHSASAALISAR